MNIKGYVCSTMQNTKSFLYPSDISVDHTRTHTRTDREKERGCGVVFFSIFSYKFGNKIINNVQISSIKIGFHILTNIFFFNREIESKESLSLKNLRLSA